MIEVSTILKYKHNNNKAKTIIGNANINKNAFAPDLKKQNTCEDKWNEVRVWSFGATNIRYCNKCRAKETFTKPQK